LSPVGDVASAVENVLAAYSGTTAAPHEYFDHTLFPQDETKCKVWIRRHQERLLDNGKIEKLVTSLRGIECGDPEVAEKIGTEANYFERNADRMRDPRFRAQHLLIGSGVVEAGCKTVIGSRLKRSGMFWTVAHANAILALRCSYLHGRFEDYWEGRRTA
jgi:hypothetical protein